MVKNNRLRSGLDLILVPAKYKLPIKTVVFETRDFDTFTNFKYHVFAPIDGKISVSINLPLFSTVLPSNSKLKFK